ncbi:MAG TPA: hypothetical protein VKU00_03095 [Chthonomonadaceae bacterium]|nr:hypothetical protein [Chthonomonadaceae bacterium]
MQWQEVRQHFPSQWVLIEATKAHSEAGKRILDEIAVLDTFPDSPTAMQAYAELHKQSPQRELLVLHTDRQELDITERRWLGIRTTQ